MATMAELPHELLLYIILFLVQLPGGAADFARIVSVCKKFILFTQDEHILKLVDFDIKMEFNNFKRYQHINSLLVKCSEAGNVAAQFMLGKVILVSSSQLLLDEWQKVESDFHPCDSATLNELGCILATNVPAQNHKVGSFIAYFLPNKVSTSEFSQTRLVHYQLVKLFLLYGCHHDLAEMSVFLKSYIKLFTSAAEEDNPLLESVNALVFHADTVIYFENQLMEASRRSAGYGSCLSAISHCILETDSYLAEFRAETLHLFELNCGYDYM